MNLVSQIAKNTFYQIFGRVLSTMLGLLTVGLMTRYLGTTGFGFYTTIVAFLQFFSVIMDFGLQMTATQLISKPGADEAKILNNAFTIRLLSAVIFLGSAVAISWLAPYPLIIKQGISIACFSFLFIALQSILVSIFQKKISMAKVAMADVWGRLALLTGVYLAILYGQDILFIILAVVIGSLVNFSIMFWQARKFYSVKLAYDKKVWRQIYDTTWPLAITIALTLVYFRADTLILSLFRSPSEVGLYGASYKVVEILVQFPYMFLGLMLPLFTQFFATNRELFKVTIQKAFDFLVVITIPMIFSVVILGPKIMSFIAGDDFAVSGEIIKVLILAVGVIYISALFGYAIVACELQKKMIKFYAIDAVIFLILYLVFIPLYGYWAAAILTVLSESVIMFASWYILKKYIHLKLQYKIIGKSFLASMVMSAVLYLLFNQNLLTLVLVGMIVYFFALYLFKGVDKDSIRQMIRLRNS
ncbi:MAG: flippase [bacterium]